MLRALGGSEADQQPIAEDNITYTDRNNDEGCSSTGWIETIVLLRKRRTFLSLKPRNGLG